MQDSAIWQFSLNALHAAGWGGSLLVALVGVRTLPAIAHACDRHHRGDARGGHARRLRSADRRRARLPGLAGLLRQAVAEACGAREYVLPRPSHPVGPVSLPKAWNEMLHRYVASFVGVMIMAIAWQTSTPADAEDLGADDPSREESACRSRWWAWSCVQGLFGKWTVTLLLKPAIVTLHLLGGMALVALLAWLSCATPLYTRRRNPRTLRYDPALGGTRPGHPVSCRSRSVAGSAPTTRRWRASISRPAMASGRRRWISGTDSIFCANWA